MEAIKVEFQAPQRGELVWLCKAHTYSDTYPEFTPYYFDFVSILNNLCFRKVTHSETGQRYEFDYTKTGKAFDTTHLIIEPSDALYLRICRTAQEAYVIEMGYLANKQAQLNAAMMREMIPSIPEPVPVVAGLPVLPLGIPPVLALISRSPTSTLHIYPESLKKAVYRLMDRDVSQKHYITAKEMLDGGVTKAKLRKIGGIGKGKVKALVDILKMYGVELP